MKQTIMLAVLLLLWHIQPSKITAQSDAAFDVTEIATAVVKVNNLDRGTAQSGVFVTPDGLIVSANDLSNDFDLATDIGDTFEISTFTSLDQTPEVRYIGEAIFADPEDPVVVIQITQDIEGNTLDPTGLDFPHYNPIVSSVTVDFLDTVFAVAYPSVGAGYLSTTRGQINAFANVPNFMTPDIIERTLYYQSDVTADSEGLGGIVVTFAGQFVGFAMELPRGAAITEDVLLRIMPAPSFCAIVRDICKQIMEGYRPEPEDRVSRPGSRFWLTEGIGLTTGSQVPRGELEVEYYCDMLGLRARMDVEETVWECFSPSDGETRYTLTSFDYDIICQQTYRNPEAIAIQDGSQFINPALRWRCYG